jgi:hypothetical protein
MRLTGLDTGYPCSGFLLGLCPRASLRVRSAQAAFNVQGIQPTRLCVLPHRRRTQTIHDVGPKC